MLARRQNRSVPGQERRARRCIYMQKNAGENNARVSEDVIVWLIRLLKGLLIGIGAILPGLSGGVLAVIFGIYDKLIVFLAHLRTNFIAQIKFFLPVVLGAVLGIFLFSVAVEAAFGTYAAQFVCLFIGFVLGTLPALYRTAGAGGRTGRHILILLAAVLVSFGLMSFGGNLPAIRPGTAVWFGAGALVALGSVVPGLSTSNFLIYFGLYDQMAAAIAQLDIYMLLPFAAGAAVCVLLTARLVFWLFQRYYAGMYHLIVGLVIGSSLALFPAVVFPAFTDTGLADAGLSRGGAVTMAGAMLLAGTAFSYAFSRVEQRYAPDRAR